MAPKRSAKTSITKCELEKHIHENDYSVAVEGVVYDMTNYVHPGGRDEIFAHRGTDATAVFVGTHDDNRLLLERIPRVGLLAGAPAYAVRTGRRSGRLSEAKTTADAAPKPTAAAKPIGVKKPKAAAKPKAVPKPKAAPKAKVAAKPKPKAVPARTDRRTRSMSLEPKAAAKPKAAQKAKVAAPKKSGKGAIAVKEKAAPAMPRGRPAGVVKKAEPKKVMTKKTSKKVTPKKASAKTYSPDKAA